MTAFTSVLAFLRAHRPKILCFVSLSSLSAFFLQPHSHNVSPHTLGEPMGPGQGMDVFSMSLP